MLQVGEEVCSVTKSTERESRASEEPRETWLKAWVAVELRSGRDARIWFQHEESGKLCEGIWRSLKRQEGAIRFLFQKKQTAHGLEKFFPFPESNLLLNPVDFLWSNLFLHLYSHCHHPGPSPCHLGLR